MRRYLLDSFGVEIWLVFLIRALNVIRQPFLQERHGFQREFERLAAFKARLQIDGPSDQTFVLGFVRSRSRIAGLGKEFLFMVEVGPGISKQSIDDAFESSPGTA